MGNTNPSSQSTSQLISKCWQPITSSLWKNKITSQTIKEKRLLFQSQQEMKYVFDCLVRRMNDYHPNVMKVFYLRKLNQKGSVCTCSQKHAIQVYVENVDCTLQKYITKNTNRKNQGLNRINNSNRKCVCMQIVKAAVYLKERYGPFIVSNKNVWLQQQRVYPQSEDRKVEVSTLQKEQYLSTMKAKLWISAEEEENFPERGCQEREMCFSIVGLIKNCLVGSGLCKCFPNMEVLERLMHVGSMRELEDIMKKQREESEKNVLKGSNVIKEELKVAFVRTRAYSSQDSSTHNQQYFAPNLPHAKFRPSDSTQQQSQRKYSLIEQIRKPTVTRIVQFISPMVNQNQPFGQQGKTNDNEKNGKNKIDNYFVYESALPVRPEGINQKTRITKMYQDQNNQKQYNLTAQHFKSTQPINPRTHYNRHLNNFITNKPIISLTDMTGDSITAVSNQTIKPGKIEVEKTKQSETKYQEAKENMDEKNDKEKSEELSFSLNNNCFEEVSKIELKLDVNKAQDVERSQEKVTDPTDRTRFDNSLKEDQKKQHEGGSTSRKNTSTIPISMNSSSLAGQFPKLNIHSYGHQRKISVINRDFEQEIIEKKDQQNQKKESAASSKSEKNYVSHHGGSDKSMEKQEQKSTTLKKRMSGSNILPKKDSYSESNSSKDHNEFHDIHIKQLTKIKENQKLLSSQHKEGLDAIGQYLGNQQLGRLRHSEYITSTQHLLQTSNQSVSQQQCDQSHMQINYLPQQHIQLSSLGLLQQKFKTNESIEVDNHQVRNQLRKKLRVDDTDRVSIREYMSGEAQQRHYNRKLMRENEKEYHDGDGIKEQQGALQRNSTISLHSLQRLKQINNSSKSSHSNQQHTITNNNNNDKQLQLNSSIKQSSLYSIRIQKQNFTKGKTPCFIAKAKKNENESEMKSLVKRQQEHPASPYEKFRLWQQNQKQMSYEHEKSLYDNINSYRRSQDDNYYVESQYSSYQQQQHQQQQQQLSYPQLSQNTLPEFSHILTERKKLSLKEQFSQLFNFDNEEQDQHEREKERKQRVKKLHQRQISVAVSMYTSSEYEESKNRWKRVSEKINNNYLRLPHPPLANKSKRFNTPLSKQTKDKFRKKPTSKQEQQQQLQQVIKSKQQTTNNNNNNDNDYVLQTPPKNILRLTSSGHEDNSIRQKVISKKAQFAELKNQMNILLL